MISPLTMAWRLGAASTYPMYDSSPETPPIRMVSIIALDPPRRVVDLFSDVAARLESVEQECR